MSRIEKSLNRLSTSVIQLLSIQLFHRDEVEKMKKFEQPRSKNRV
jgi:hypothetical protein